MSHAAAGASAVPLGSPWQATLLSDVSGRTWPAGDDVLEHDVGWLLSQCDRSDKRVLVVDDGGERSIPFFLHDGQIDFDLGELTFASTRVRRYVLVGNFTTLSVADWNRVFEALHTQLASNAVVFLMGVVAGEALEQALAGSSIRRRFLVSRHGPSYERRMCRLGADLEAYLSGLISGRRQDLRRSLRRFEREFEGRFDFRSHTEIGELEAMFDAIDPVSARTYQARLRGLSLSRYNHSGREVIEGAKRKIARCYLLSVDGMPVAWRIGFLYRGIYCSHHIGYDPDFERWHPGVVLHLKSIADLSENVGGVRILDMLYGDNEFKRKASNLSRTEAHYYLFPRTVRGRLIHALLTGCDRLSQSVGEVLERRGLKAKIKRWIRGR